MLGGESIRLVDAVDAFATHPLILPFRDGAVGAHIRPQDVGLVAQIARTFDLDVAKRRTRPDKPHDEIGQQFP